MRLSIANRQGQVFLDGRPVRSGDHLELQIRPERPGGDFRWIPVTYELGANLEPRVILPLQQRRLAIPAGGLELRWAKQAGKGAP